MLLPTLVVALALAALPVRPAHAQSDGDKSVAEALFQEGKRLMNEGKFAEACPKLAESQRIDPGAGTLTALALCHRGEGKMATAWSEFREVVSLARKDGRKDREQVALENAAELEPKLSRLRIHLDPGAEQQDLQVKIDDTVVNKAAFGSSLPVDPGKRRVTATSPLKKTFETYVQIGAERDEKTVNIPPLAEDPEAIAAAEREKDAPAAASFRGDAPPRSGSGWRTAGLITGGIGLLGVGAGAVTGLLAKNKHDDAVAAGCAGETCPDAGSQGLEKDAGTFATVSTITFIAGGALVAGGAAMYLFAPKRATTTAVRVAPSVDPRGGGSLSISGVFF